MNRFPNILHFSLCDWKKNGVAPRCNVSTSENKTHGRIFFILCEDRLILLRLTDQLVTGSFSYIRISVLYWRAHWKEQRDVHCVTAKTKVAKSWICFLINCHLLYILLYNIEKCYFSHEEIHCGFFFGVWVAWTDDWQPVQWGQMIWNTTVLNYGCGQGVS